jgi:hypothetical protein
MHSFDAVLRAGNVNEFINMLQDNGVNPVDFFRDLDETNKREEYELVGCMCEKDGCKKCDLSEDECKIIFNSDLSLEERKAKLQLLRGEIQVKPKSFRKRLTEADAIHAQALGIRL